MCIRTYHGYTYVYILTVSVTNTLCYWHKCREKERKNIAAMYYIMVHLLQYAHKHNTDTHV